MHVSYESGWIVDGGNPEWNVDEDGGSSADLDTLANTDVA